MKSEISSTNIFLTSRVKKAEVSLKNSDGIFPPIIAREGPLAAGRFAEFFTVQIANANTRAAYGRATAGFFAWCENRGIKRLAQIDPLAVALYVRTHPGSRPSVQQALAAVRMLLDWLVSGGALPFNPAASVRAPKFVAKQGKTPILTARQTRRLLDAIESNSVVGLRDRALIAVMTYGFARVSAAVAMRVRDYRRSDRGRAFLCLHEKGGREHSLPAHRCIRQALDAYLAAAGIGSDRAGWLFRSAPGRSGALGEKPLDRHAALRMVKRRALDVGLSPAEVRCHTFRATGITVYLQNGGRLECAQVLAAHESPRTTKLYDRTANAPGLKEIERVRI